MRSILCQDPGAAGGEGCDVGRSEWLLFARCCAGTAAVQCQSECHRLKLMFVPFAVLCGSERGKEQEQNPGWALWQVDSMQLLQLPCPPLQRLLHFTLFAKSSHFATVSPSKPPSPSALGRERGQSGPLHPASAARKREGGDRLGAGTARPRSNLPPGRARGAGGGAGLGAAPPGPDLLLGSEIDKVSPWV